MMMLVDVGSNCSGIVSCFCFDNDAIAELVDCEREMGGEGGISSTWSSTTVDRCGTVGEGME